jgi:carbon monoxide dehydrogenase subunit G
LALRIEKTFQVSQSIEKVWALLSDPAKVASCVPGAQITEKVDDKTYKGSISVKVGPSVTDYKGEVQILRLDPQNHEIEIQGKGQDVRGRGSAAMTMTGKLASLDGGLTQVTSISEVNVVGILAQMGSRVITEVSNVMFDKFSQNFQELLQQSADQPQIADASTSETPVQPPPLKPPQPIEPGSIAWQAFKQMFGRWLQGLKNLFSGGKA